MKFIQMTALRTVWMASICLGMLSSNVWAAKPDPTQLLKQTKRSVEKLLETKIAKGNAKALEAREKKIRTIIKPFFNFRMLAKKTLAEHWKKRNKTEKAQFTFWLRALLQQAYLRGVKTGAEKKGAVKPKVSYTKQTIKSDKATVFTEIRYLKKSKRRRRRKRWKKIRVDWQLVWQKKHWIISDILTNENSLMDTYKEQFSKIISKKSYAELVKRIQKKVNQLRKKQGLTPLIAPKAEPSKK